MTAVDDRPTTGNVDIEPTTSNMVKFFENLEVPEGVKVELLRGEIVMMAGPDWSTTGSCWAVSAADSRDQMGLVCRPRTSIC